MPERVKPKKQQRRMAISVGLFVILTLAVLIISIFWIKNFSLRPAYSFSARFLEPPYITNGSPVYFRGLKVGRVGDVSLTPDSSAVLVKLDIHEKQLRLPVNTRVAIHTEGITGIVYVVLSYPDDQRPSPIAIQDGMIVQGVEPFSLEKLQRSLNNLAEKGKLDEMFNDAQNLLHQSQAFVKEYRMAAQKASHFMDRASSLADNSQSVVAEAHGVVARMGRVVDRNSPLIEQTLTSFRDASGSFKTLAGSASHFLGSSNGQAVTGSFQDAAQSVKGAMNQWQNASQEMGQTFSYIRGELQQTGLIRHVGQTASKLGLVSDQANTALAKFDQAATKGSPATAGVIQTVQSVHRATQRFDCIQTGVADILSQRFLLFKLAFGKPGAHLDQCETFVPMTVQHPPAPGSSLTKEPTPLLQPVSGGCTGASKAMGLCKPIEP